MNGWVTKPIAEIAEKIAMGPFGSNIKVSTFVDQGVPIISGQHLHGTRLDEASGFNFITDEHAEKLKNSNVFPGDIVFTHAGTIGQVSLIPDTASFRRYVISQRQFYLRVDKRQADPAFVTRWFHAPVGRHRLMMHASQVGVPSISRPASNLKEIQIDLPPLGEQQAISETLDIIDDKIELNRRMAATLEEMARALYRSWFVDFDPVKAKAEGQAPAFMDEATAALFPDRFGDDGLPEGWETQFLLDQSLWVNGAAYKNMHFSDAPDALPVIKIAELKAGITGNTKFTATDLGEKFRITRGELLFSWSGNPDTSIDAFIWSLGEAWLNQHIFAVRPNGRMSKAMLFTCLRFFMPEMAEIARNKQTTGLGHITRKDLEAFPISVAPRPVMSAFDERVFPIFDRYCECLFENQTLKELRDTLLPKLMSGELRVGEARYQVEEVA